MSTRLVFVLFSAALLSSCSSSPDAGRGQCHPCTVSKQVGPLLNDAKEMINAKNYQGATAKLNEAEAVKFNRDDETVINQFRHAIEIASSRPPQP